MESDTSLALLLDILCNSQCVKEHDGSVILWYLYYSHFAVIDNKKYIL